MGNAFSAIGVLLAAAGLLLAWVKLKPSERRLAKQISSRAWRASMTLAMLAFFLWSNYHFFSIEGPITRFQIVLLIVVYAEMMALAVLFLVGRLFDRVVSLQERMSRILEKSSNLAS